MIPLTRPALPKLNSLQSKLTDIFKSGMITNAKYTEEFEKKCAKYLGVKYAIAVSSGTSALMLAMKCLDLKGEVILPSFTFTSDGHALLWNNLKPVFVDVDVRTYNLDPDLIEKKITKKTSAILPTHVFGNPCQIDKIQKIAKKHKLKVIYDAAHAFGAKYKGRSIAAYGDLTMYSLTPTKVLPIGEGGLIVTNNKTLAYKLKLSKFNGDSFNRNEEFLGLSARLSETSAIVGIEGLKIFNPSMKRRLKLVDIYKKELDPISGITFQDELPVAKSVFKDLAIVIDKKKCGFSRDQLLKELLKNDIQTKVYFDPPLHKKKVYRKYRNLHLPATDFLSRHIIDLPLSSNMPVKDVKKVCWVIKKLNKK